MPRKAPAEGGLPPSIVASKAVARREQYNGRVFLGKLPRLAPALAETTGTLQVELEAGKDGQGAGFLKGRVRGKLVLDCQRGLHPFEWPCDLAFELRLVQSEAEEEQVLHEQDPYRVEDDRLPLVDIVEDELLLALPMMPRCPDEECLKRLQQAAAGAG